MRARVQHAWFLLCTLLARLLRAGRYSEVRFVDCGGEPRVHKRRLSYAPLLVFLGGPLMRVLDTGVRVLPQRDWEVRERRLHEGLHGVSIRIDANGTLSLPRLGGETLAALLEQRGLDESARKRAMGTAVEALAALHSAGFTHGDAMAENVLVDLDAGVARWFDFETVHDPGRPMDWRRADDLRALLATCLLRSAPQEYPATLHLVLDAYGDEDMIRLLVASFTPGFQRPLVFHLGQAALSFAQYQEIARLLRQRSGV